MTLLLPRGADSTKDSRLRLKINSNDADTGRQYTSSKKGVLALRSQVNNALWSEQMMAVTRPAKMACCRRVIKVTVLNEFTVFAVLCPKWSASLSRFAFYVFLQLEFTPEQLEGKAEAAVTVVFWVAWIVSYL